MSFRARSSYDSQSAPAGREYGLGTFGLHSDATTSRVSLRHSRGGGGDTFTGGWVINLQLPPDFRGFASGTFVATTYREGATTSLLVFLYNEAAVLDPAYAGGHSIRPTADGAYEPFVLPDPTGTYAAGERILIDVESVLPGNTAHRIGDDVFEFNL